MVRSAPTANTANIYLVSFEWNGGRFTEQLLNSRAIMAWCLQPPPSLREHEHVPISMSTMYYVKEDILELEKLVVLSRTPSLLQ